jgi:serine/threonine protein kinase
VIVHSRGDTIVDSKDRRYRVIRSLGEGGQGAAYLVSCKSTDLRFALKRFSDARAQGRRLIRRRIKAFVDLELQSLSPVLLGPVATLRDGLGYLAPAIPNALDLAFRITHPWPLIERVAVAAQLAAGIAALEQRGFAHCDLALENVIVSTVTAGLPKAYIIDFDAARGPSLADPGMLGHPEFLAPELAARQALPSMLSDRYSFAVLTHVLLLLRFPPPSAAKHDEGHVAQPSEELDGLPITVLCGSIQQLLKAAFTSSPDRRPSAFAWYRALSCAMRSVFACSACGIEFFNDADRKKCPVCGVGPPVLALAIEGQQPVVLDRSPVRISFSDRKEAQVIRKGVATYLEETKGASGTSVFHKGSWCLVRRGAAVLLKEGTRLRFGNRHASVVASAR